MAAKEYFPGLCGNRELAAHIGADIESGMLAHAYIIEGPEGSGRHFFVRRMIAALFCENAEVPGAALPCGQCRTCTNIISGKCTDVITVCREKDKATLGVERIREMTKNAVISAGELDYKCYIIDDADKMTPPAQNALLMTLEEPRADIRIFLICQNSNNLLPTVRSRAPVLRMQLLRPAVIAAFLKSDPAVAKQFKEAQLLEYAAAAGGCIGKAYEAIKKGSSQSDLRARICALLALFSPKPEKSLFYSEITRLFAKNDRQSILDMLGLLNTALRDIIALRKCADPELCFYFSAAEAKNAPPLSILCAVKLSRLCDETDNLLRANTVIPTVMRLFAAKAWKLLA